MEKNIENQNIKRRSTFAVLFYINRTKVRKDGMCQLLCKVSIDAEWAQIGTKVSVNPSIWNPDKGRADGRSENAVTVNRVISYLPLMSVVLPKVRSPSFARIDTPGRLSPVLSFTVPVTLTCAYKLSEHM